MDDFLGAGGSLEFDPSGFPGVVEAAFRIEQAVSLGERIVIHGDYDADGISGTAILAEALHELGADVRVYLPSRIDRGYDLHVESVEQFAREGANLIVTVDCGTSAIEPIRRARSLGMDVIVTDHHIAPSEPSSAIVMVNPKCAPPGGPFDDLSGSGVAFLLSRTLRTRAGRDPDVGADLAALGTIADVMSLTGLNRRIVALGLKQMRQRPRPGIEAIQVASKTAKIGSQSIAYSIVPRLNAAGRIQSPEIAYRALTATEPEQARRLAAELEQLNLERQRRSAAAVSEARLIVRDSLAGTGPLLVPLTSGDTGVFGLVAGQLARELGRQVFVVDAASEIATGSARSGSGGSVHQTLNDCADLLVRFGGHAAAAGFTIANGNLEALALRFREMDTLASEPEGLSIEGDLDLERVSIPLVHEIEKLEPFGNGNPEPLFIARRAFVQDVRTVGKQGEHIQLTLRKGKSAVRGIGFRLAAKIPVRGDRIDAVVAPFIDSWQGRESPRLRIEDLRPAVVG